VINVGGAIGATMSPVYAACARHIVNTTADLIFVDFAVNDLFKPARTLWSFGLFAFPKVVVTRRRIA
jgi:hypothetical protein